MQDGTHFTASSRYDHHSTGGVLSENSQLVTRGLSSLLVLLLKVQLHNLLEYELSFILVVDNLLQEKPQSKEKLYLIGVYFHQTLGHFLYLDVVSAYFSSSYLNGIRVDVL